MNDISRRGILAGDLPSGETLFACFAPEAHHVTGEPRMSRLSARLAPYRSEAEAKAGLEAAGATVTAGGGQ